MTTLQEDAATLRFIQQRARARALFQRANQAVAGGVGHDMRYNDTAPTYITHARGSRKWDVDGNEYVDYMMALGRPNIRAHEEKLRDLAHERLSRLNSVRIFGEAPGNVLLAFRPRK